MHPAPVRSIFIVMSCRCRRQRQPLHLVSTYCFMLRYASERHCLLLVVISRLGRLVRRLLNWVMRNALRSLRLRTPRPLHLCKHSQYLLPAVDDCAYHVLWFMGRELPVGWIARTHELLGSRDQLRVPAMAPPHPPSPPRPPPPAPPPPPPPLPGSSITAPIGTARAHASAINEGCLCVGGDCRRCRARRADEAKRLIDGAGDSKRGGPPASAIATPSPIPVVLPTSISDSASMAGGGPLSADELRQWTQLTHRQLAHNAALAATGTLPVPPVRRGKGRRLVEVPMPLRGSDDVGDRQKRRRSAVLDTVVSALSSPPHSEEERTGARHRRAQLANWFQRDREEVRDATRAAGLSVTGRLTVTDLLALKVTIIAGPSQN